MTRNPLLDPDARLVIAHRGNRVRAAENTVDALRQAMELGADALEFDVRISRDGVPVLMHDPSVDRTTNGTGLVGHLTFAELHALDASRSRHAGAQACPVPALEEALDAFREIPLVIEVKELAAAEATADFVRRFGAQDRVVVGSAETSVMRWFYRSGLHCCASMHDAVRWIPHIVTGTTPAPPPFEVLSITPAFRGIPIPVSGLARVARRVGVPTQVWTINSPAQAQRLWKLGIAGIVTDDPALMLRARNAL